MYFPSNNPTYLVFIHCRNTTQLAQPRTQVYLQYDVIRPPIDRLALSWSGILFRPIFSQSTRLHRTQQNALSAVLSWSRDRPRHHVSQVPD